MSSRSSVAAAVASGAFIALCLVPFGGLGHARFDTEVFKTTGTRLLEGDLPYRDFTLEYPPGAVLPLAAPAVAGADRYESAFVVFQALTGAALAAVTALALAALGSSGTRLFALSLFTPLALFALGPIVLIRFDLWPALFVVGALALATRDRTTPAFASLAVATAAKLYALALLPLFALATPRTRLVRALGVFAAVGLVFALPFVAVAPGGVAHGLRLQLERPLQLETVGASALLVLDLAGAREAPVSFPFAAFSMEGDVPDAVALVQAVLLLAALAYVCLLFARTERRAADLVAASTAAIAAVVLLGKVLSPQFLVWLVPLVALTLARDGWFAAVPMLAAAGLTHAYYPGLHDELVAGEALPVSLLLARNVALLILFLVLLRDVRARARAAPDAARGSCSGRKGVRSPSSSAAARAG